MIGEKICSGPRPTCVRNLPFRNKGEMDFPTGPAPPIGARGTGPRDQFLGPKGLGRPPGKIAGDSWPAEASFSGAVSACLAGACGAAEVAEAAFCVAVAGLAGAALSAGGVVVPPCGAAFADAAAGAAS